MLGKARSSAADSRIGASSRYLVERAETYVRTHAAVRVPLSQLCHTLGVSERTLRNAFYRLRGVSPTRALRAGRLLSVRRALERPCSSAITVTGVATTFGFYELGRFAAAYRVAFGETPSATLRAAGRRPAP